MSHEGQIRPQVNVGWGCDGGGVYRCIMHLHSWGCLWWHHCGWANAPKCCGLDSMSGRGIAPMYDRRGNVSGRSTAPLCGRRGNVCGRDIAPMYDNRGDVSGRSTTPLCGRRGSVCGRATAPLRYRWANLAGHYRWWQLTNDSLHDCARATCKVVSDNLWCGHGSTSYGYAKKWIQVCTIHGAIWCSV